MAESVIDDLAVLEIGKDHCPYCGRELISGSAFLKYLSFKGARTCLISVLECLDCNECFGTFDTIEKMYNDPCSDDRLLRVSQLQYHIVK